MVLPECELTLLVTLKISSVTKEQDSCSTGLPLGDLDSASQLSRAGFP